jgi:hypothetical protein
MLLSAVEDATPTTISWTTPTIVVAIVAPLLALVGVLISNWWNGRNAIKAENMRHANGLVAEGVRHQNALDAENVRSDATIRAENLRHENALRQAEVAWVRGAKAKAYFGIIASTTIQIGAARQSAWFMRPLRDLDGNLEPSEAYNPTNIDSAVSSVQEWNEAHRQTQRMTAEVRAVGDPRIAKLAERVSNESNDLIGCVMPATRKHADAYKPQKVGKKHRRRMAKAYREMIELIRSELGADPSIFDPVPSVTSDPGAATLPVSRTAPSLPGGV